MKRACKAMPAPPGPAWVATLRRHGVLVPLIGCLALVAACTTASGPAFSTADETASSGGEIYTLKHGDDLEALNAGRPERIRSVLDELPATHRVEVEVVTVSRAVTGYEHDVRYAARISAIDAAGRRDGPEINYSNWYQAPTRLAQYRQGKLHGVERHYSRDGKTLLTEIPWENGEINGVRRMFHPNATVQNETAHTRGTPEGESRTYDREGRLIRVVPFVDGRRHGASVDYWSENPDQIQRSVPYVNGQVHGIARAYYLDGTLNWERRFVDNGLHGVERHFDGNGDERRVVYWLENEMVSKDAWKAAGSP